MLLFRSEEEIDAWCAQHDRPRGGVVAVAQLHELALRWYGDRLDPAGARAARRGRRRSSRRWA